MKREKVLWGISALIFGLVLAGCDTGGGSGRGVGLGVLGEEIRLTGPVYYWVWDDNPSERGRVSGDVEVVASTGDTGSIIDGMLDIVISSATDDYECLEGLFWWPEITINAPSNTIIHILRLSTLPHYDVGRVRGTLHTWDEICYIYVSNAVTISTPQVGVFRAFNMTLQPGWNAINIRSEETAEEGYFTRFEVWHRDGNWPWRLFVDH